MSRHSFDPEIAMKVGLNAAVIYQNIVWWIERNAAKGKNVRDGNVWTYNSVTSFEKLFPYLTGKQIRTALQKLEDDAFLLVGNFNEDGRDRTKWYALPDDSVAFAQMVNSHLPLRADTFAPEGRPLPVSKPDSKHTPIVPNGDDLFSATETDVPTIETVDLIEEGFNEFWNTIWPKHHRKMGKADCEKTYRSACIGRHKKCDSPVLPEQINSAARAYIASLKGDLEFLKGPLPWLRLPGWEAFMGAGDAQYDEGALSDRQRGMLQDGICPPSMMDGGKPNAAAKHWLKRYGFGGRK